MVSLNKEVPFAKTAPVWRCFPEKAWRWFLFLKEEVFWLYCVVVSPITKVKIVQSYQKWSRFENSASLKIVPPFEKRYYFHSSEKSFWQKWCLWEGKIAPHGSQNRSSFSRVALSLSLFLRKMVIFGKRHVLEPERGLSCGHGNGSIEEPFWLHLFFQWCLAPKSWI